MVTPASPSLLAHFAGLKDPRQSWKVLYPLPEVLLVVLCGTLAGAEDVVEICRWGGVNLAFLRRFLPFEAGVPSHDTLNDLINAIDGDLFAQCFSAWVEDLARIAPDVTGPEIVAIDGKTSRRSHDHAKGSHDDNRFADEAFPRSYGPCGRSGYRRGGPKERGPLHLVSAWAEPVRDTPSEAGWGGRRRGAINDWCSASRRARPSRTRSPPFRCRSIAWL